MTIIQGTLKFAGEGDHPIHNFRVGLREVGPDGKPIDSLATDTNLSGSFRFDNVEGTPTQLVGYDRHRTYDDAENPVDNYEEAFVEDLPTSGDADFTVPFWSYRDGAPVPRAGLNAAGKTDQQHASGYGKAIENGLAQVQPIMEGLVGLFKQGKPPTLAEVQAAYPAPFTAQMDRFADHSKSDAWLGELVLNGFNTNPLLRESNSGHIAMDIRWTDPKTDDLHDSSDVTALFEVRHEKLFPVEIRLATLSPGEKGQWKPVQTLTQKPGDEHWEYAKRVFRCQYLLSGALEAHIIKTHLLVEQYCIAAYRNLRVSPLRDLLMPHLQEVVPADTDADDFAWGPEGQIPVGSVLKFPTDVEATMQRLLGQMDWAEWSPRPPTTQDNKYAKLLNVWWELMGTYVDEFFVDNRASLENHWEELQRFSADLYNHSPDRVAQDPPEGFEFLSANEIGSGSEGRSVTRIIENDSPNDDDLNRLKQACRYLLTHATFIHTWVHQGQYDVGGDMFFASLSLSGGDGALESKAPAVLEAIVGLFINSNGRLVNFGYLLENEVGDVPPRLRALLQDNAPKFRSMGFEVSSVRSRINI